MRFPSHNLFQCDRRVTSCPLTRSLPRSFSNRPCSWDRPCWKCSHHRSLRLRRFVANRKSELRVTCYLIGENQNPFRQKPCEVAKTNSRTNFGEEIIAGAHKNRFYIIVCRLAQALLRHAHPQLRFKEAVAHVHRLKRNQLWSKRLCSIRAGFQFLGTIRSASRNSIRFVFLVDHNLVLSLKDFKLSVLGEQYLVYNSVANDTEALRGCRLQII